MKTTYEFLKEKIQNVNPFFAYRGENFDIWQQKAKEKFHSLLGLDKFERVLPETEIEYTKNCRCYRD